MQESADHELLAQYARQNSEDAYALLVERHLNLVYSVALRHVTNPHQAEEITQAVFLILARKAGSLSSGVILTGWLYRTARLTAANYLRMEKRRQSREQEAYMQSLTHESAPDAWTQIAPMLDAAMERLGPKDRDAILLRFFEDKSIRDVGTALHTSEDATQKRLERALKKLRGFFTKRGVTLSAATLVSLLSAQSVQAAPRSLAEAVTTAGLAKSAASGSSLLLMKSTLKLMTLLKIKTAVVAVASVILVAGTTTVVVAQIQKQDATEAKPATIAAPSSSAATIKQPAPTQGTKLGSDSSEPPMSAEEAKQKGIAALVNQKPIYWSDIDKNTAAAVIAYRQTYTGDNLKQKIATQRRIFLKSSINRQLIIQDFKNSGDSIAEADIDYRIDYLVKIDFDGNKDRLLKALAAHGDSFEEFRKKETDDAIVQRMVKKHVFDKINDYFTQNPQLLTGDDQNKEAIRTVESRKTRKEWFDDLTAKATIQTFDDPGPPENLVDPGPDPTEHMSAWAAPANRLYPLAIPLADKPGFVMSPYVQYADPIDVRGYPPGSIIRCPYTDKLLQLPPAPESK